MTMVRRAAAVVCLMLVGLVAGWSHANSGAYSEPDTGRVANAAGTCVLTVGSSLFDNRLGLLCTNTRLGRKGECVSFTASNLNAAGPGLPAIGGLRQVASSECKVKRK